MEIECGDGGFAACTFAGGESNSLGTGLVAEMECRLAPWRPLRGCESALWSVSVELFGPSAPKSLMCGADSGDPALPERVDLMVLCLSGGGTLEMGCTFEIGDSAPVDARLRRRPCLLNDALGDSGSACRCASAPRPMSVRMSTRFFFLPMLSVPDTPPFTAARSLSSSDAAISTAIPPASANVSDSRWRRCGELRDSDPRRPSVVDVTPFACSLELLFDTARELGADGRKGAN